MIIRALVYEQLESDGTLATLEMQVRPGGNPMVVAFPDEYDEPRVGPFHFLDMSHEDQFKERLARCRARRVGPQRFHTDGNVFHFGTSWSNIPLEPHELTYYALSLPKCAVPSEISVVDPASCREYQRTVFRDDEKQRYVIYVECRSVRGSLDLRLSCAFRIAPHKRFLRSSYDDKYTGHYAHGYEDWRYLLPEKEAQRVYQIFIGDPQLYSIGQAGAIGPGAQASRMTFNQTSIDLGVDLGSLAEELARVRQAIQELAGSGQEALLEELTEVEKASREGNKAAVADRLKRVGGRILSVAQSIGAGIVVEAIAHAMGF